ncbi:MAG TPA: transposase [Candidatus Nanoarchaeia archaeon]|nr:transposase [Candidatus Nanoarchaeia archaeon]
MKFNPTRYSSAVGEVWIMLSLKTKYCHNVFDKKAIREYTDAVLTEALQKYEIHWRKKSFDSNHVHINLCLGIYSKPEITKKLKGFTAPKILKEFWWLKSWLFRGGGFWNPATDGRSGDMNIYDRYLDKQKYSSTRQKTLVAFVSS